MIGATVLAASVACRATLRLERLRQCCNFGFTINHPQVWRQTFRCFDAINAVEYRALNMKASILAFQLFSPQ
jgi:hypothetical protein